EFNERVDADNLRQRLDAYVHGSQDFQADEERKAFVGALSRAVLKALLQVPPETALKVGTALRTALDEKHMLLVVHDPSGAALLARAGWDGALLPADDRDYLLVTHSNLTANKHDREIEHEIAYRVRREGDVARATLRISLKSRMQFNPAAI